MATRATRLLCCGALTAASSIALWAVPQFQQQPPTFRGRTDIVQVDVVAVAADGQPVRGLTKDDFTVFDGGRPRPIELFTEISHDSHDRLDTGIDVVDNASQTDRVVIVAVDDLHYYGRTAEVKAVARRVITEIGDAALMALVTSTGRVGVEPTADRQRLLEALDKINDKLPAGGRPTKGRPLSGGLSGPPPSQAEMAASNDLPLEGRGTSGDFVPVSSNFPAGSPTNPVFDLSLYFGNISACHMLSDIARMLGTDATHRKAFVWISRGGSCEEIGDEDHSGRDRLLATLQRANVVVYSVDPGGDGWAPGLLGVVSRDSGGFVVRSDDYAGGLGRLVDALNNYYLLGFSPASDGGPTDRRIQVRCTRPGVTVRARTSYGPRMAPPKPSSKDPLIALATNALPTADLALRMTATVLPAPKLGRVPVLVTFDVTSPRQGLAGPDGSVADTLRHAVLAVNLARKAITDTKAWEDKFFLPPDRRTQPDPLVRYRNTATIELPPGRYQLRLSAQSDKLAAGGSVYLPVDVPDLTRSSLAIGGVALYSEADEDVTVLRPPADKALPFTPSLDRTFAPEDDVRVFAPLWRQGATDLEVSVAIVDRDDRVVRTVTGRVAAGDSSAVDITVPLRDVRPGRYRIRVSASDGTHKVQMDTAIVVR